MWLLFGTQVRSGLINDGRLNKVRFEQLVTMKALNIAKSLEQLISLKQRVFL